ncbi:MAG: hypothetical protein ABI199_07070 [Bacteroidia bacterium]
MNYFRNFILSLTIICLLFSCKKDIFSPNTNVKLNFSQSTVYFDTVLTTVGTVTQSFTVYNRNSQDITISSIKLALGNTSNFRINVDGVPVPASGITNVLIRSKDSLFVFVAATINPTNHNNPILIQDSVMFLTNGNTQTVDLMAYGQDAYFYKPNVFPTDGSPPYIVLNCNDVWNNDKPHVILGYAVVNSSCTLTINAGTQVYVHNNGVLYVNSGGTLKVQGTYSNPVTFQGDRLDPAYSTVAGQWGKIWLSPGSLNNTIDWAIIKNGTVGVEADTLGQPMSSGPTLKISNTIIKNMSNLAIAGLGSYITGFNCVFADCQSYSAAFQYGGKYSFKQCTFADYWSSSYTATGRQTPLLLINNWYQDVNGNIQQRAIDSAYFGNCIFYGNLNNEIGYDSTYGGNGNFNVFFQNCLMRTTLPVSNGYHYSNNIVNQDPQFNNVTKEDYTIGGSSAVIGKGNSIIGNWYPMDLNNKPRISPPDIGAYQH